MFFGNEWGDLAMIFTSEEVTSENFGTSEKSLANYITSDQKIVIHGTNVSFYFLHAILCSEHTTPLKTIMDHSFRHCRQNSLFRLRIVMPPQLIVWHAGLIWSDLFDRNKILSGGDLSHYQVPHCIKSFLLFCLICVYSSQFSILFWIMYLL